MYTFSATSRRELKSMQEISINPKDQEREDNSRLKLWTKFCIMLNITMVNNSAVWRKLQPKCLHTAMPTICRPCHNAKGQKTHFLKCNKPRQIHSHNIYQSTTSIPTTYQISYCIKVRQHTDFSFWLSTSPKPIKVTSIMKNLYRLLLVLTQ